MQNVTFGSFVLLGFSFLGLYTLLWVILASNLLPQASLALPPVFQERHRKDNDDDLLRLLVFTPLLGSKPNVSHARVREERFAVQNWLHIAAVSSPSVSSIRLLGLVEVQGHCAAFKDLQTQALESGRGGGGGGGANTTAVPFMCLALPEECLHADYDGIPKVDCLFTFAKTNAKAGELLMYTNSDVIFSQALVPALRSLEKDLVKVKDFVVVGMRTETELETFMAQQENRRTAAPSTFWSKVYKQGRVAGTLHEDHGVDYFIFPSDSSLGHGIPPFLVGRYRWDNALLASFVRAGKCTIDATDAILALHPSHGQNGTPESGMHHSMRLGADFNNLLAETHYGYSYTLGRINNTAFNYSRKLSCNDTRHRCRSGFELTERAKRHDEDLIRIFRRAKKHGEDYPSILLVPVWPHQVSHAQMWLSDRGLSRSVGPNFMLLASSEDVFYELLALCPDGVLLEEKRVATARAGADLTTTWATFDRLLRYKVAVAIVDVESSINCSSLPLFLQQMKICDVTIVGGYVAGVRPTSAGTRYWEHYKVCRLKNGGLGKGGCQMTYNIFFSVDECIRAKLRNDETAGTHLPPRICQEALPCG